MITGSLDPATRARTLQDAATTRYDVVVVGGGITGAGVALDAASRGLSTLLVEQHDLASGTSRWSSKLVHGGLRYLATGQLGIAWESAVERAALLGTIAPHLVRPLPQLFPAYPGGSLATGLTAVGLGVADVLRRRSHVSADQLAGPRLVGRAGALGLAPGLRRDGLRGGLVGVDGRLEDDARLVVGVARTAAALGAHVLTRVTATSIREDGVTLAVTTRPGEGGGLAPTQTLDVAARCVVVATGVWAGDHDDRVRILPSRGSHLVLRSEALGSPSAVVMAPVPGSLGSAVFAIPHPDGLIHLGLTDEAAPGVDPVAPPVPEADESYLLDVVSRVLARPLTSADVVGRFAGLRPLIDTGGASRDVSRRHLLLDDPGLPVTIAGGKLTTYRRMAQDTVDAVCQRLGRDLPCMTTSLPLVGAASPRQLADVMAPARLVRRYGTEAPQVAALAERHPELAGPVAPGSPATGVEMLFGALHEGALTVEDLLERRTRAAVVDADVTAARETAQHVLALAGAPV